MNESCLVCSVACCRFRRYSYCKIVSICISKALNSFCDCECGRLIKCIDMNFPHSACSLTQAYSQLSDTVYGCFTLPKPALKLDCFHARWPWGSRKTSPLLGRYPPSTSTHLPIHGETKPKSPCMILCSLLGRGRIDLS